MVTDEVKINIDPEVMFDYLSKFKPVFAVKLVQGKQKSVMMELDYLKDRLRLNNLKEVHIIADTKDSFYLFFKLKIHSCWYYLKPNLGLELLKQEYEV